MPQPLFSQRLTRTSTCDALAPWDEDDGLCFYLSTLGGLEHLVEQEIREVFGPRIKQCGAVSGKCFLVLHTPKVAWSATA